MTGRTREPGDIDEAIRLCVAGDEALATEALTHVIRARRTRELLDRAVEHGVFGEVSSVLRTNPAADEELVGSLALRSAGQAAHQLRILEDLRWFATLMHERSIPWVTFKGPVVAQLLYRPASVRAFQDLDLAIPRERFADAIDALEAARAPLLDENWRLIRRESRGQLHVGLPLGTLADVHWHLLNRAGVRRSFAIDMDEIFGRARDLEVEGIPVRTFDAVDTLVHVALHAALAGADRLSWLEDCRRSIEVEQPAWEAVVLRARSWRAGAPIAVTLRRARDLLGVTVPEWVLHALEPSSVRRGTGRWIERRWPLVAPHTERSPVVLWAQVARDGGGRSVWALGYRFGQPAIGALHRLGGEPGRERGASTGAIFQPSGDAVERDRYMRAVARGDA